MFQGEKFFSVLLFVGFVGVIVYVINLNSSAVSEEGLEVFQKQHQDESDYTILLTDMDYHDDKYWHKYKMLIDRGIGDDGEVRFDSIETADWMRVSPPFFKKYENALGMEISRSTNGIVTNSVAPPGYSGYVGNDRYGEWRTDSHGHSFWHFYGQYMFMRHFFMTGYYGPTRTSWRNYDESYRRNRRDYYGPTGTFGTGRYTTQGPGKRSTWGNRSESFKSNVRSRVTRSSSRYSGSSSRSRSGGFGK